MSAFNLRIPLPEDGSAAVKTWSVPPLNTIAFFPTGFSPHTVHGLFERHSTVQEAITATCHFMHDYFQVTNLCAGFVPASLALRSEEHTSELQSQSNLVCRLLLEK